MYVYYKVISELDNLSFSEFSRQHDFIPLDVRHLDEFQSFHLPDAIHIDIMDNSSIEKFSELDKHANYLVYCALGVRSRSAIKILEQLGFENLYHLADGILNYSGPTEPYIAEPT